jgi:hypothetical protein
MAMDIVGGLNSFYLIQLLENLSQLQIGYDNDIDDINQDLVLQFLKEGFQTIVNTETRWPWFETSYQTLILEGSSWVNTFTQTSTYSQSRTQIVPIVPISEVAELINVIAIQGNYTVDPTIEFSGFGQELIYLGQHQAERWWVGSTNQISIPTYFSLWSNQLYLWPRPNQTYSLYIRGYRAPDLTWLENSNDAESTNYVDLDLELQACLIAYTMSRMYQFQEDPEMSSVYRNQFATNLKNYQDYLTAPSSNQPLVYSGGLQLRGNFWGSPGMSIFPGAGNGPATAVAW